jgi:hypothetical protein
VLARPAANRYGRFVGTAVLVLLALLIVGFFPTRRLGGDAAIPAMVAGASIGFLSAAVAGWLLVAVSAPTPTVRMQRAFLAMVVRLAVVAVLGLAAALSGELAQTPLLIWLATTYVVLLPLEVLLAIAPE